MSYFNRWKDFVLKHCGIKVDGEKRLSIMQHLSTFKHIRSKKRYSVKNELSQCLTTQLSTNKKSKFNFH